MNYYNKIYPFCIDPKPPCFNYCSSLQTKTKLQTNDKKVHYKNEKKFKKCFQY